MECNDDVPDRVVLSVQSQQEPIPQIVSLPEVAYQPCKPPSNFRGKTPLPRKLDLHCLQAGARVAQDARRLESTLTRNLTGKLAGFRDTTAMPATDYGTNNQCANFVSTFAHRLGLKGHYLVTGRKQGLPWVTGSNNGGHSYQTVSGHTQSSGRFYTRPVWRDQH